MNNNEKKNLFLSRLNEMFPAQGWVNYIGKRVYKSFRVINIENTQRILNELESKEIVVVKSQIPNAYSVLENFELLSSTEAFNGGDIYIQGLSSMLPVLSMDISADAKVLDMTAAPGSKTIQLYYENSGKDIDLVVVEKDFRRFQNLLDNLKKYSVSKNITAINIDANLLAKKYPKYIEYFDYILLDAPCSTEIDLDPSDISTFKFWNGKKTRINAKWQKDLIDTAIKLLKPGGELVYSTCTYSVYENEEVVDYAIKKYDKLKLIDIILPVDNTIDGIPIILGKTYDQSVKNAKRILPDDYMSGFFIAKFIKSSK